MYSRFVVPAVTAAFCLLLIGGCAHRADYSYVGKLTLTPEQRMYWSTIRSIPVTQERKYRSDSFVTRFTGSAQLREDLRDRALKFLHQYSGYAPEDIVVEARLQAVVVEDEARVQDVTIIRTRTQTWTYKYRYEITVFSGENQELTVHVSVAPGGIDAARLSTTVEQENARNNARILTHYLRSGDLRPALLAPDPEKKEFPFPFRRRPGWGAFSL